MIFWVNRQLHNVITSTAAEVLLMQSSIFADWVCNRRLNSHVLLPGFISLLLIAMYFSGNSFLQNIVAPKMDRVPFFSAREFGVLEMLQNFVLLYIVVFSIRCFKVSSDFWIRLVALCVVFISAFTFLEEIDYGAHFIEYFTGQHASMAQETWTRNLHNRVGPGGTQIGDILKIISYVGLLAGFVLAPLFFSSIRHPTIRLLVPSRWVIVTIVMVALLGVLARALENAGYSTIEGSFGCLHKNLSEFRELNLYYLLLLYTANLYGRIVPKKTL